MSFAEVMAEIPRFSREQLRTLISHASEAEKAAAFDSKPLRLKIVDGHVVVESSRIIRQEEVDRILEEFP